MGIPGILKEIGKGERVALSKLAIDHLERHNRPLRIAIDAAIWNFQTQSGQGGKNPALRTLFFRLLRLLALPVQPVFVYDGKNKPLTKRGRTVTRYASTCVPNELSKVLVRKFSYPWHVAPGEAEAECALLQKRGVVDMVMSQDVDAIMFGAGTVLRDWSKEGTRGNKAPTHVNVMDSVRLKEISGLDSDGMILVALLSGGDYDEAGLPGFGSTLACEIARAGFGKDLIEVVQREDWSSLQEWRERLQFELETNESGYFKRKHKTLHIPSSFPDLKTLGYYTKPVVSKDTNIPEFEAEWERIWNSNIDVPALRAYTTDMFDWNWKSGARRLVRCLAQPLFQDRLRRGVVSSASFSVISISEKRQHFTNDGIPELRLSAVPADIVGLDIEAEEDNPNYLTEDVEEDDDATTNNDGQMVSEKGDEDSAVTTSPSKRRKTPYWDPYAEEKWWIPEIILQLGLPAVVEDWYQLQRDILADPKKFATRRIGKTGKASKQIDASMKTGAIHGFFRRTQKSVAPRVAEIEALQYKETRDRSDLDDFDIPGADDSIQRNAPSKQARLSTPPPKSSSVEGDATRASEANLNDLVPEGRPLIGSSFSEAITIESSPITNAQLDDDEIVLSQEVLGHITQRRPRRKGPLDKTPSVCSSPSKSPSHIRRPIEAFFIQTQRSFQDSIARTKATSLIAPDDITLPPELSTGLGVVLKRAAQARESLPGTWKNNHEVGPPKRAPRVSCVDLTGG